MPRSPLKFKQSDVQRLIRAARKEGIADPQIEKSIQKKLTCPAISRMAPTQSRPWVRDCSTDIMLGLNVVALYPDGVPERITNPPISWVYVIECDSHVKIGFSCRSAQDRLKSLSTANFRELKLLKVIGDVSGFLEIQLHERFAQYRVRGEWFRLEGELKAWIETGCKL